jgi:hypothetical protein
VLGSFYIGLAVGENVSLNRDFGCALHQDTVIVVATAMTLRFGVNVTIQNLYFAPTVDVYAHASARSKLGGFNSDVGRIFDFDAISRACADRQAPIQAVMLIPNNERRPPY